jgi:hypothetical protein
MAVMVVLTTNIIMGLQVVVVVVLVVLALRHL